MLFRVFIFTFTFLNSLIIIGNTCSLLWKDTLTECPTFTFIFFHFHFTIYFHSHFPKHPHLQSATPAPEPGGKIHWRGSHRRLIGSPSSTKHRNRFYVVKKFGIKVQHQNSTSGLLLRLFSLCKRIHNFSSSMRSPSQQNIIAAIFTLKTKYDVTIFDLPLLNITFSPYKGI